MQNNVSPVDRIPPLGKMMALGLQHVLVMYTGTIAIPMLLGNAIGLSLDNIIVLINTNLLISGVATLVQTIGFWKFGARIPLIQGCSFVALTPVIMIGQQYGLNYIFGAAIICGVLIIIAAPVFSRLLCFFPPVVIGSLITIIGISLIPTAARWLGGGDPAATDFGSLSNLSLGLVTMIIVLLVHVCFRGFIANNSILIGLLGGTMIAAIAGYTDFGAVNNAPWFALNRPFAFGLPKFAPTPIVLMLIAMIVIMIETMGVSITIGNIVDRKATPKLLTNTLRGTGLSTMLGGIFSSFPNNTLMQNACLIALTNIKSRYVITFSGVILILLGFFPKLAIIVAMLPPPVLGGATIIIFGITIVAGIRELSHVSYEETHNTIIVAVSISIGILPISLPLLFSGIEGPLKMILQNGAFMGAMMAVLLNSILNSGPTKASPLPAIDKTDTDDATIAATSR
ncbi:MAG: Uracil-xanthine permease [Candidatus Tokpelaia sp. JSC189]|nr:MAG: Uracil-xanthine permease [Candidatus Tokpelaia sp. JSC189]